MVRPDTEYGTEIKYNAKEFFHIQPVVLSRPISYTRGWISYISDKNSRDGKQKNCRWLVSFYQQIKVTKVVVNWKIPEWWHPV